MPVNVPLLLLIVVFAVCVHVGWPCSFALAIDPTNAAPRCAACLACCPEPRTRESGVWPTPHAPICNDATPPRWLWLGRCTFG